MHHLLVYIFIIGGSQSAQAGGIDQLFETAFNMGCFNCIGRERDRQRAEADRKLAAQRNAQAKKAQENATKLRTERIANSREKILFMTNLKSQFLAIEESLASQRDYIYNMSLKLFENSDNHGALIALVKQQNVNLKQFLSQMTANNPKGIAAEQNEKIKLKLSAFLQQIELFPAQAPANEIDDLISNTLTIYEVIGLDIKSLVETIVDKISKQQKTIEDLKEAEKKAQEEIKRRNTPPKPLTVEQKEYNRRLHSRWKDRELLER